MKIYVLPVSAEFQPDALPNPYPQHNLADYGVEQDFWRYLKQNQELITREPDAADWHYCSIFWTRYQVGHGFGECDHAPLQHEVDMRIIDPARTFTIVDYADGPFADMPEVTQFVTSSIGTSHRLIYIPLLCDPHPLPFLLPQKRWLASF